MTELKDRWIRSGLNMPGDVYQLLLAAARAKVQEEGKGRVSVSRAITDLVRAHRAELEEYAGERNLERAREDIEELR
jgi:hypothetical protein